MFDIAPNLFQPFVQLCRNFGAGTQFRADLLRYKNVFLVADLVFCACPQIHSKCAKLYFHLVGLIIMTLNQELDANTAMPWFMLNRVPQVIAAGIFVLILAAGMSSADSCLNSAAILVVNDVIRPFRPERPDKQLIRDAKMWTVVIGVISSVCAIYASSIISLFSRAYAMAGSGLVPLLVIGLLWKERKDEPVKMKRQNSKVTPWGARCGIVVGAVFSQIPAFGSNATIIGLLASSVVIIVVSLLTKNIPLPEKLVSPGFVEPIE